MQITCRVDGPDDDILAIRGATPRVYGVDEWPLVLGLLNAWHASHRWPTASMDLSGTEGCVLAALDVFLPAGVHDDQLAALAALAALVAMATKTICDCHTWLDQQHPISDRAAAEIIEDLEEWFLWAA